MRRYESRSSSKEEMLFSLRHSAIFEHLEIPKELVSTMPPSARNTYIQVLALDEGRPLWRPDCDVFVGDVGIFRNGMDTAQTHDGRTLYSMISQRKATSNDYSIVWSLDVTVPDQMEDSLLDPPLSHLLLFGTENVNQELPMNFFFATSLQQDLTTRDN